MEAAIQYAKDHTNIEAAVKYKVSESTIRRWRDKLPSKKDEETNENDTDSEESSEDSPKRKTIPHVELEVRIHHLFTLRLVILQKKLMDWIKERRDKKISINMQEIRKKALDIAEQLY